MLRGPLPLLWLAVCLAAPPAALAQRVTGVVQDARANPLAGAVVSVLDSAQQPLARGLADAFGRYSAPLPQGAAALRVVRLGYQPRSVDLPARREELVVRNVVMTQVVTLLSTLDINDKRVCSLAGDRAAALSLWEQARDGLLTAVVAREDFAATVSTVSYERAISVDSGRVIDQTSHLLRGKTARPFSAAVSPEVLAAKGYWNNTLDVERFRAPDEEVIVHDSFAATHCFSVRQPDSSHAGAIGLGFEPVRGRDSVVDVSGTIWMDATVPALRSVEFSYTDPDSALRRAGAGGLLEFQTMPNGVVFIENWVLRFPVLESTAPAMERRKGRIAFTGHRRTPLATGETGGMVLDAEWPDGTTWDSRMKPLAGTVSETVTAAAFPDALVVLEGTRDTLVTDAKGQFKLFPALPGRYVIKVLDTAAAAFVPVRVASRPLEIVAREGADLHFELPGRTAAIRSLCAGFDYPAQASTLLGRIVDGPASMAKPKTVSVVAAWFRDSTATEQETQTITADSAGRFSVCGVPRDQSVLLTATRPGTESVETPVVIPPTTVVAAIEWPVEFRLAPNKPSASLATLRGHVLSSNATTAIPGAEIWFPTLDRRATTDADGAYEVTGLPAGQHLVQVRSLGFGADRGLLQLTAGQTTTREYHLSPQSTLLDTIRVVATANKRMSPLLKEFESRRQNSATGYFIADSALRASDRKGLTSVVMGLASGLKLSPGHHGASLLSSSRRACAAAAGAAGGPCAGFNCYVTVYVDAVLLYSVYRDGPDEPPDLSRFNVSELTGVEFYPGRASAPSKYAADAGGCGTLLLWTRER